ncbi:MAG: anaerobic ribonucleoside-triphosphate reductase activating protein [Saprospiraceae bacterium]|nr:anaerobic ribonucleoside-triphosphate reductase activating protein [Saprospiraceae bacterium]
MSKKSIYSITPFTVLDYPDKTSCIIWFSGCNMRCVYCYNPEIVLGKGRLSFVDISGFLESRKHLLDAVVLSGGECLLHDSVLDIVKALKDMGFLVKIDTNGSRPLMLKSLIEKSLIDYVSLDFKATSYKFETITLSNFYPQFEESLKILNNSGVNFEVRTTVHSSLLGLQDIESMAETLYKLGYKGIYFLQHFCNDKASLGNPGESWFGNELNDMSKNNLEIIFR